MFCFDFADTLAWGRGYHRLGHPKYDPVLFQKNEYFLDKRILKVNYLTCKGQTIQHGYAYPAGVNYEG